jgi:hypothetical protein
VADRAQDPVGDRTLVGALDRAHARLHGEDALERILDADGQAQQQQAEAVAELARQRLVEPTARS